MGTGEIVFMRKMIKEISGIKDELKDIKNMIKKDVDLRIQLQKSRQSYKP